MLIGNEAAWLENLITFAEHNKQDFEKWLKDFGYKNEKHYAKNTIDGMKNLLQSQRSKHIVLSAPPNPKNGI